MARWSDAIRLTECDQWRGELSGRSGCYELGYVRTGYFYPAYVGKAKCLWDRIQSYNKESCHNPNILEKHVYAIRKSLYFHFFYTLDYGGTESRLLDRWRLGEEGLYKFNGVPQNSAFEDGYDRAAILKGPAPVGRCGNCRKGCLRYGDRSN